MDRIEVEETLNNLIDEVESAKGKLSAGSDFGLSDISERIAEVCGEVTFLAEEDILEIQPLIQRLRDDLTSFANDIEDVQELASKESDIIDVPTN